VRAKAAKPDPRYRSGSAALRVSTPGPETQARSKRLREETASDEPARHILRRRTVEWFIQHPDAPGGAIPNAVKKIIGGPRMWSDEPVKASQFTSEQRDLLLRAYREIRDLHTAAGGRMERKVTLREGLGLMPETSSDWPYQSEEWAAERALNNRVATSPMAGLHSSSRLNAELTDAYFVVTTWIDYVKGGLLDASAIYEDEEDY
jgi:hypothetical protein